ncbi:MAG: PAS domain-containing protein [Phenylobacterium sp.]|nr:PAS domain-containing protein [Phenylobacterium sp.]
MGKHEPLSLSALAASFFDASTDCVKVVGLSGDLLAMNANGVCLMEIEDFESLRGQPWVGFWPPAAQHLIENALTEARAGRGSRFTADCPTAAGTPKSWEVVVWRVLDDLGQPAQVISISRDVTAQQRAEQQRQLFTRELAHRMKNTFAVVDGVIALSSRSAGEARTFVDALRQRLLGLGRAIAYMAPPEFTSLEAPAERSVQGLLQVLLGPYGGLEGAERQIFLTGDDMPVGPDSTTILALIFNELATNALKYGALTSPEGRVDLHLKADAETLRMSWSEALPAGTLIADTTGKRGFGAALLERAVVKQLGGTFERALRPGGIQVIMSAPLKAIAV